MLNYKHEMQITSNYLLSSRFHTHSSALTSCNRSPSIIDSGLPLIATYMDIETILHQNLNNTIFICMIMLKY